MSTPQLSLYLLFCFKGSRLNWVMISWKCMMVPICSLLWLDRLMALKSRSSSLVAVTSFICYLPPITVAQTVASRYSMKVRVCYCFLICFFCLYIFFRGWGTSRMWWPSILISTHPHPLISIPNHTHTKNIKNAVISWRIYLMWYAWGGCRNRVPVGGVNRLCSGPVSKKAWVNFFFCFFCFLFQSTPGVKQKRVRMLWLMAASRTNCSEVVNCITRTILVSL